MDATDRWLIALDIDGTLLHADGTISDDVAAEVRRVACLGHEVTLATGRSAAHMRPVLSELGLKPEYVVCSNGAITLRRDAGADDGYRREFVETFNPTEVLTAIRSHLVGGHYAVEDDTGFYRYTDVFPGNSIGSRNEKVPFEELLKHLATRVVVISPDHHMEDFLAVVERMGLHRVSYAIGWTAWLDIAPDGVNKATALERVRDLMGISRTRVLAVGDGRNDIDMLKWASGWGRGVAMAHAPAEVMAASNEIAASLDEDGVARLLEGF
ncbi:MAG: HAD-IIB family hydrolase [Microbacteriaceae bacterium]